MGATPDAHAYVAVYWKGLLHEWQDAAADAALWAQSAQWLAPLLRRLRARDVPADMLKLLVEISRAAEAREYAAAGDAYVRLAIGNARWPIGVTAVGIHDRAAREKVHEGKQVGARAAGAAGGAATRSKRAGSGRLLRLPHAASARGLAACCDCHTRQARVVWPPAASATRGKRARSRLLLRLPPAAIALCVAACRGVLQPQLPFPRRNSLPPPCRRRTSCTTRRAASLSPSSSACSPLRRPSTRPAAATRFRREGGALIGGRECTLFFKS
jgi:hypothetical protein